MRVRAAGSAKVVSTIAAKRTAGTAKSSRRDVFLSLSAGIAGWGLASGLSDGSNAALAASPKDLKAKSEARKAEMKARAEAMRAEEMKNAAPPPPPPPPPSEEAPPPPPQDGGA